mgnify:FL=1
MPKPDTHLLSDSFKTLAHPRRARIFKLLAERPELGHNLLSLKLATRLSDRVLDHHLRIMERAGLLRRRRKGAETQLILQTAALMRAIGSATEIAGRMKTPADGARPRNGASVGNRVTLPPPAPPPITRRTGIEAQ